MFFNSFDRKLKKMYARLNPAIKNYVFPKGEYEFAYVGHMFNAKFPGKDIVALMQLYASVYSYYTMEMANAAKTYAYAKKKCNGQLSDAETLTLVAMVALNTVAFKVKIENPVEKLEEFKGFIKDYIERVTVIKNHPDVFMTQRYAVGERHNPILVDGVKGVHDYIDSLDFESHTFGLTSIKYERTSTVYLKSKATSLNYAIDQYTITLAANGDEIAKLWFNIYGTENSCRAPGSLKFKPGTQLAVKQQQVLKADALADNAKKERANAVPSGKAIMNTDSFADYLVKKALKAVSDIMIILAPMGIPHDPQKLFAATTAYCFTIWMVSFNKITLGQARKIEEKYRRDIIQCFKDRYKAEIPTQIKSEESYRQYLWDVNEIIRTPYEEHGMVLADYGISDSFIKEFIAIPEDKRFVRDALVSLIFDRWAKDATQMADFTYIN